MTEEKRSNDLLLDLELLSLYDGIGELRYTSKMNRLIGDFLGSFRHYEIVLLATEPGPRIDKEEESPWPNFCKVCGELAIHIHFSTGGCCGRKDCCEKLSKSSKG